MMWDMLFDRFLTRLIRVGALAIVTADGARRLYGEAQADPVTVRFHDPDLPRKIVRNAELAVGEAYMDGRLSIDGDDLHAFFDVVLRNMRRGDDVWWRRAQNRLRHALRHAAQWNPMPRARANVAHHYDLSGALYDLFLDKDRQYSCAYFRTPQDSLEKAQDQKKALIAAKLLLQPGMQVLDIGCGWGGMGLTLARDYGAQVLGVTLSQEQHRAASARAKAAGLSDRVQFKLMDYRQVAGQFDRIVSVGMFEHVGVPHYREYFAQLRAKLKDDGIALIHTIGRSGPPATTSPFILKYIFPGGYVPAMSEVMTAVEKEHLVATDIEVWRLHYAQTLQHWQQRFEANADKVRKIYDERFIRMWRYYLVAAEMTFRRKGQVVFQFQLTHHQDAAPLTRDYLAPLLGPTPTASRRKTAAQ